MSSVKESLTSRAWDTSLPKRTRVELSTPSYALKGIITDKCLYTLPPWEVSESFAAKVGTWHCDMLVVTEITVNNSQPGSTFQEFSQAVARRKLLAYVTREDGAFQVELEVASPPED